MGHQYARQLTHSKIFVKMTIIIFDVITFNGWPGLCSLKVFARPRIIFFQKQLSGHCTVFGVIRSCQNAKVCLAQ